MDAGGAHAASARAHAERAARERLVASLLRELDPPTVRDGEAVDIALPAGTLRVALRCWSPSGHHRLGDDVRLDGRPVPHAVAVDALLAAVAPAGTDRERLAALVAESVAHTAPTLAAYPPGSGDRTRDAEQSVRVGHPLHPTPKSAEGFTADDLAAWAPERGASFVLHHLAVDPALVLAGGAPAAPPPSVAAHLPTGWTALPMHPFQARLLARDPTLALLTAEGAVRPLGPLGDPVWPTSSVRTVVDTVTGASWKLPLRARLTHFVRTTPVEQARRAIDAGRVVGALGRLPAGFGVIPDVAFRTLDPATVGDRLAADLTVIERAPFPPGGPRVLAAVLEEDAWSGRPPLLADVHLAGDVHAWLRRWLAISLAPLLHLFGAAGIGFEAHPQNTLITTDAGGWPVHCWVRDLEGAHVRADRLPPGLSPDSPLVYSPPEAWRRLRYHAVVNHLGLLVAVLGRHTVGEAALWATAADALAGLDDPPARPWARDLCTSPTLPAKAHLRSWVAGRGETPLHVEIPNPLLDAGG